MITNPTALYRELANYTALDGVPSATPECVASLISDTDPNDDPQRLGLDMLAAHTIRELIEERDRYRFALNKIIAHAAVAIAQRAPSDDAIIAEHIVAIRDLAVRAI